MGDAARAKALETDRERWTANLEAVLSRFLAILKRDFAAEIEKDPKRFKSRVIELMRQGLLRKRKYLAVRGLPQVIACRRRNDCNEKLPN